MIFWMDRSSVISKYFSQIGRRGGLKSRRKLSSTAARDMVRVREARRAFKEFYTRCFWSYDPKYKIMLSDIPWVIEQLKKLGNRSAWEKAISLCR